MMTISDGQITNQITFWNHKHSNHHAKSQIKSHQIKSKSLEPDQFALSVYCNEDVLHVIIVYQASQLRRI